MNFFKKATTLKKSDWEDVLGSWVVEITINFYTIGTKSRKKFVGVVNDPNFHSNTLISQHQKPFFLSWADGIKIDSNFLCP